MNTIQASDSRNFVLFETDLFILHQPDEAIGRWSLGGDCAGWFYTRLLLAEAIRPTCEPVMEDWGWTFAVSVDRVKVHANIWAFHDLEGHWLLGLESYSRWPRRRPAAEQTAPKEAVADSLDQAMTADPRIRKHAWLARNPWEAVPHRTPRLP